MLKKTILLLTYIMLTSVACSPIVKSPVARTQKINTPLSPTLTKMPTFTHKPVTPTPMPTPTDSFLRSVLGSITVMSGGYEKYNKGIGLLNLESGEIQNLFPDGGMDSFAWSPDGKQIAFDGVNDPYSNSPQSDIYIIDMDRKELNQVTNNGQVEYGLDWSSDGTQIAYVYESHGANPELALLRLSDSVLLQITSTKDSELYPSFSPDGKTLAYVYIENYYTVLAKKTYLMLMDIKNRTSKQVPLDVPILKQRVSWSPDGKTIAFVSGEFGDGCGDIYLTSPDGLNLVRVTKLINNCAKQVVWSPDGKYLAFIGTYKDRPGNMWDWGWQIYVMDSQGQNIVQVTHEKEWIVIDIRWVLLSQ